MSARVSNPSLPAPATPFKFLDYYKENDEARFAGRDREIDELADAIGHAPTLIVYGKSGLGKTSLFLAGVFPELRCRDFLPIHVRTLQEPLRDVLQEVKRALGAADTPTSLDPTGDARTELLSALRGLAEARPVVIVLDQFEEFFIRFRGQRDVYEGFVAAAGAIVAERGLRVHVVFSLREEYLADLDDFRARVPGLFENEYRLRPMTAFGVRQTITRPLELAGVAAEPRLISKLVDRLAQERFDSVVLQILCQEVYEHAVARQSADFALTEADLDEAGNIDVIFRRYLDEMARALPASRSLHARVVLRRLTTEERTKRALRLRDFSTALYQLEDEEVLHVLEVLKRHRLLRTDTRGGEDWYELTHERLVPILDEWLRLDPEFNTLLAAYDLIVTPSRSNVWRTAPQNLLSAGYLSDVVAPFRERLGLSEHELEFLVCSALYHRHRDIEFWSAKLGIERARSLVFEKLHDGSAAFRRGAAFSAAYVSSGHEPTVATLLELALRDPDGTVRREAGLALARLRGRATDQRLEGALSDKLTRRAALETLADLCAQKADVSGFSRWDRYLARRLAKTRILEEKKGLLIDASREGALGGLYGALAWTLIAVPPYALLFSFYLSGVGEGSKLGMFVLCLCIALFGSIALGALLTVFVSRSVASQILLAQQPSFARALLRSKAFFLIPVLWVAGMTLIHVLVDDDDARPIVRFVATLLPAFFWFWVPLTVRLAQGASSSNDRFATAVRSGLLAAVGMPVLVPWALAAMAHGREADRLPLIPLFSLLSIPVWSGLSAVISIGLLRMWLQYGPLLCPTPADHSPKRLAPLRRLFAPKLVQFGWLPALSVASLVGVLSETGLGLIPIAPASGVLHARSRSFEVPLPEGRQGMMAIEYLSLRVETPQGLDAVVRFSNTNCREPGNGVVRLDGDELGTNEVELLLDAGDHELVLTPPPRRNAAGNGRCDPVRFQYVGSVAQRAIGSMPETYAWFEWIPSRGASSTMTRHAPSEIDSTTQLAQAPISLRASIGGKTRPNAVVAIESYGALLSGYRGYQPATATCGAGVVSYTLETRSRINAVDGKLRCVARADRDGNWNTELALTVRGNLVWDGTGARSLVRWKPLPEQLNAVTEGPGREVDASFLDLSRLSVADVGLQGAHLVRAQFRHALLTGADFTQARAGLADLSDADLSRAELKGADLQLANLTGAKLQGASFKGAVLHGATLDGATVGGSVGDVTDFSGADLTRASLLGLKVESRVDFTNAKLSRATLSHLDLTRAQFLGADLSLADIGGSRFSDAFALGADQLQAACGSSVALVAGRAVPLKKCPAQSPVVPYIFRDSLAFCATAPSATPSSELIACKSKVDALRLDASGQHAPRAAWINQDAPRPVECSCPLDPLFRPLFSSNAAPIPMELP